VGGLATSLIFLEFLLKAPPRALDEPILFDADARARCAQARRGALARRDLASDFGLTAASSKSAHYAIRGGGGPGDLAGQGQGDIALQLVMIQWEAAGLSTA